MSLDFAYLSERIPIINTIRQIMLGVGWALLIGNLVFQATRGMAAGLGFDAEDPKLLFTRTFAFSFLLVASPQICELGLKMTSTVMKLLQMPDAVEIRFADEASFSGLTGSWLLVVICGIIVMFQAFRLIRPKAARRPEQIFRTGKTQHADVEISHIPRRARLRFRIGKPPYGAEGEPDHHAAPDQVGENIPEGAVERQQRHAERRRKPRPAAAEGAFLRCGERGLQNAQENYARHPAKLRHI
jgi:hypothetical protein